MTDRQTLLDIAVLIESRIKDYHESIGPIYNAIDIAVDRDVINILLTLANSTDFLKHIPLPTPSASKTEKT